MKLQGLTLKGHDVFGDITIPLSSLTSSVSNYKTIIIGPNGTGKSNLLRCIADALTIEFSEDKTKALKPLEYEYKLDIYSDSKVYSVTSENPQAPLPIEKLLAVTSTPQDRFPFVSKKGIRKSDQYVYLGLKTASNNVFFSNLREELLLNLFTIYKDETKKESAIQVLSELKFSENFKAVLGKGKVFNEFRKIILNSNDSDKVAIQENSLIEFSHSDLFKDNKQIIQTVIKELEITKNHYSIDVRLEDRSNFDLKVNFLEIINKFLELNILSVSELSLFSKNGHDMNQASSGEYNILKIFLSIIANISSNSIVLIDEPEISLHPNWQMDFISLLDIALSKYKNCHSIIATHSHFLISNISNDDSIILNMSPRSNSRKVHVEELEIDPFGWSPENILYRVFGVTGLRNKYFELDLRIIIDFVATPKDDSIEFMDAMERVKRFNIKDKDPLFPIISTANEIYERMHS